MEKTIKQIEANPASVLNHLYGQSLRANWTLMTEEKQEKLLNRFGYFIDGSDIELSPDDMSDDQLRRAFFTTGNDFINYREFNWPTREVFVGNWDTYAEGGYFETFGEALEDGLEALLEEFEAEYVFQILLDPSRCPIKEANEAEAIMKLERGAQ